MKKKLLTILLSTVMIVASFTMNVFAEDHNHEGWINWGDDELEQTHLPDTHGNYYLTHDVNISDTWDVPEGKTNLCLNGYVINANFAGFGVIKIGEGATLNLYDCGETEHKFVMENISQTFQIPFLKYKGKWNNQSDNESDTVKKVIGGCITGGFNISNIYGGSGISVCNGGDFTMNGGNIIANCGGLTWGGGVYINGNSSQFTMNDGMICENLASNGGGVFLNQDECTFIMNGGKICDNTASTAGGGVDINDYEATIKMLGGEISGNAAGYFGGGISFSKGTVILGGNAKINDNKKQEYNETTGDITETLNNLYLDDDCTIQFDGENKPLENMKIGISLETLPTNRDYKKFTNADSNINGENYIKYFFSDNAEYSITKVSEYKPNSYLRDYYLALTGEYPLYVGDTNLNVSNKNDVFNDDNEDADDYGSVHYDPSKHILTLDNATILENESYRYGISTDLENLIIELKGENKIGNTVVYEDTTIYKEYNVRSGILGSINDDSEEDIKCDITFTGDGDLTIYDYMSGIYAENITFDENFTGKLKIEDLGALVGSEPVCAIHATGDVTIKSGSFDLTSYYSSGIQASGDVLVTGNVDIKINDRVQGINASNVKFDDNFTGTVKIIDEGLEEYVEDLDYGCAINASNNVTIGGGTFDLTSLNSNGINAGNTISIGGENTVVKAKGGKEGEAIIAGTKLDIDTDKLSIINGGEYTRNTTKVLNPADTTKKNGYVVIAKVYTVTFSENGHGVAPSPQSINVENGGKIKTPDPLSTSGYTFGGWYKDDACTQAWNFKKDTVTQNLTLYAKWIANSVDSATIGGNVTEVTSNNPKTTKNVPNATVELYLGTVKVAATTTDTNGDYSFNNVENETYNIVVTKTDGKTKTELVTINDTGAPVDVELPLESVNSKVEHTGNEVANTKTAIKQAVVGGLDEAAKSQAVDGKTITIKLQVKPMDESTAPNATEIKQEAGDIDKVEFIDMSLFKQINNGAEQPIGDNNDVLLTIVIPFDFTNVDVDSVMILRHHGSSEKLTKNPANGEEGFKVDKNAGTITIYAKKFSSYAVAYNNVNDSPTPTPNPDTKPRYKVPNTGVEGTPSNNHSLLKLSSLSLLAIGTYLVIKKKKDN